LDFTSLDGFIKLNQNPLGLTINMLMVLNGGGEGSWTPVRKHIH